MRQLKIIPSITNRDSKSLEKYFSEIGKEDLITPEEEVELAQRIKKGDQKALEKLVNANLRFVVSVAKKYQHNGLSLQDLINEGNIGLIKAAQKFDETRGFKFVSYAVWWIRQNIRQALAEQSRLVRLPLNKIAQINKINKMSNKLEQEFGREPSLEELSQVLDLPIENVQGSYISIISFDTPLLEDGSEKSYYEIIENPDSLSPEKQLVTESLLTEIERSLKTLTPREEKVIKFSFGIGCSALSNDEIGKILGMTGERVQQVKEKAIRRLRIRSKFLNQYLGY